MQHAQPRPAPAREALPERYLRIRRQSEALVQGLSDADMTVQSMEDASPAKWHLAHTTWFFEEFVLAPWDAGFRWSDPRYRYLFNSYYEAVGPRHPRPRRGMLTRPAAEELLAYRARVDAAMAALLQRDHPAEVTALVELGVNHEQQHQELLLTDLLHLFAQNPLRPAYRPRPLPVCGAAPAAARWLSHPGGRRWVGHRGAGFAFDCEGPAHEVLLAPFRLAARPVNNGEWCEFIDDGGYRTPSLWLSDGWARVSLEGWQAPLYWERADGAWRQMSLQGLQALDPAAPVAHLSYYEADAYARWAGARLPTEFEWEAFARELPAEGNFADSGWLRPVPAAGSGPLQMYGDVWEWTASPYVGYPGYRPAAGAVGEYNGKFMCGQFVLRGGSCATPAGHVRATYRNFFYPHQRWQFAGLRLAGDAA